VDSPFGPLGFLVLVNCKTIIIIILMRMRTLNRVNYVILGLSGFE
jgi:hypothetical protein